MLQKLIMALVIIPLIFTGCGDDPASTPSDPTPGFIPVPPMPEPPEPDADAGDDSLDHEVEESDQADADYSEAEPDVQAWVDSNEDQDWLEPEPDSSSLEPDQGPEPLTCPDGYELVGEDCVLIDEPDPPVVHDYECESDQDCDDYNPCTMNRCQQHECVYQPQTIKEPGSCMIMNSGLGYCKAGECAPLECAELGEIKDSFTTCNGNTLVSQGTECVNHFWEDKVVDQEQCDFGCAAGECQPECSQNTDCDDQDYCTFDFCHQAACEHQAVPYCDSETPLCQENQDCYDGQPCTIDVCLNQSCFGAKVPGCDLQPGCLNDFDCHDSNPCTEDSCLDGACYIASIPGCEQPVAACQEDEDCDDGLPCTYDICLIDLCLNEQLPNCGCVHDSECDDQDFCTIDACVNGLCANLDIPGCGVDLFEVESVTCNIACPLPKQPIVWTEWYTSEFENYQSFTIDVCNLCAWELPAFNFNCQHNDDYGNHEQAIVSCDPAPVDQLTVEVTGGTIAMLIFELACSQCD
jgi:hypothetical protein